MVDVAGVDVGAALEQEIDDADRSREVERHLAISAALVQLKLGPGGAQPPQCAPTRGLSGSLGR